MEVSDIENHSQYKADGVSVSVSAGLTPQGNYKSGGISGIGYGTDSNSQTSTTYGAVTGIAGKSDVTTANVGSLNEVLQNNFDKDRVNEQINAQVQIIQEYGKEIPKAIGDYASNKQLELINKGNIEEAKKWGEGGIYRVVLHTLSSALATGSIEGAVAGSGTAIVVPKVDEYLQQQDYDEATRKAVLVGLSAGIGGAVGDNTAGAANNVNQTENNYLNHIQLQKWADQLKACGNDNYCKQGINAYYQNLSKKQDAKLNRVCITDFNNAQCKAEIANFYAGFPENKISPFASDYTRIESLGGGTLRANVTMSNDFAFSNTITRGIANISRAENRPMDAIAADLMHAEVWGGGFGRLGAVTKAKPANPSKVTKPTVNPIPPEQSTFPPGSVGSDKVWTKTARIKDAELPRQGRIRYIPPSNWDGTAPIPRDPNKGYLDKFGNEWTKGPSRTAGQAFEWDVQLSPKGKSQIGWTSRDGSHVNVSLDGKVTHK